ncbi:MAG: MOSC domain-containing protein, partial [Chloroflexi bacterium]|nr:MOSC domain-containing protein [Chloroflexota bacterium]
PFSLGIPLSLSRTRRSITTLSSPDRPQFVMRSSGARIGERWQIGTAIVEVSQPRVPCYKLGIRMQNAAFPRRFAAAGRPGACLRIVQEGTLAGGD